MKDEQGARDRAVAVPLPRADRRRSSTCSTKSAWRRPAPTISPRAPTRSPSASPAAIKRFASATTARSIDAVYAKAAESKLVAAKVADAKPPPAIAKPRLSIDDLAKVKPIAPKSLPMSAIKSEIHGHRDLVLAVADASLAGPLICTANDQSNKAVCKKLPPAAARGRWRAAAPRGARSRRSADRGLRAAGLGRRVHDRHRRAVITGEKFGWAYRRKDGSSVSLTYKNEYDKKFRSRRSTTKSPSRWCPGPAT